MASLGQLSSQIADSTPTSERAQPRREPSSSPTWPLAERSEERWSWGEDAVRLHAATSPGSADTRDGSNGDSADLANDAGDDEAGDDMSNPFAAAVDASANSDDLPEPFAAVVSALRTGRPFAIEAEAEAETEAVAADAASADEANADAELVQDVVELDPEADDASEAAAEVDDADVTEIVTVEAAEGTVATPALASKVCVAAAQSAVAAAAPAHADNSTLATPAERVRFSVPITVEVGARAEGGAHDGAILNLSESGIGCVLSVQLSIGTRLTMRFRPGLAEQPLRLAGEVVWRRQQGQRWLYGIGFGGVSRIEAARIAGVVRERAEGRAGEWPLPLVPAQRGLVRRSSVWLTAAGAFAAGAALSFVLAEMPNRSSPADAVPAALADEHPRTAADASPTATPPVTTDAPSTAVTATAPAATAATTASPAVLAPATKPQAAPGQPTKLAAASADAIKVGVSAAARKEPAALAGREGTTPAWRATAHGLELTLFTAGDAGTVNWFWLDNPRRFVVDVDGTRSATTGTEVLVQQPLLRRVRVGNHPDKVRFVLEVTDKAAPEIGVRAKGNAVHVSLHAR